MGLEVAGFACRGKEPRAVEVRGVSNGRLMKTDRGDLRGEGSCI